MKRLLKINIQNIIGTGRTISNEFHEKTSFDKLNSKHIPYEKWPVNWKKVHYKEYPRFERVNLTSSVSRKTDSFLRILEKRRSERNFDKTKKISLHEISKLLNISSGINGKDKATKLLLRSWPSAGARYPLDCYILNKSIEGLTADYSYHYNIKRNWLEKLFDLKNPNFFVELSGQEWVRGASCFIVITASFARNKVKYGDRGYRYCLLDSGHLAQNMLLLSTFLGLKSCPIGGFSDKLINDHLDLDGVSEAALYIIAIGK